MSRFLSVLRSFLPFTGPSEKDSRIDEGSSSNETSEQSGLTFERLRMHRNLLEAWTPSPCDARHRLSIFCGKGQTSTDMPRGLSEFAVNLGEATIDDDLNIQWRRSPGIAGNVTIVTRETALNPTLSCSARVRVKWERQEFPFVRIRCMRWVQEGSLVRPSHVDVMTIPAECAQWEIPLDWLGAEPLELRLTPHDKEQQGLTEHLILPSRLPRIEAAFERVLLPLDGTYWRRLQLVVRVPPSVVKPSGVHINWLPYDAGVKPVAFFRHWPENESSISIPFENISMRGDRIAVRLEAAAGYEPEVIWYAVDRYTDSSNHIGIKLTEGSGLGFQELEYVHKPHCPTGAQVNILSDVAPLSQVPGVAKEQHSLQQWSSTLLSLGHSLRADPCTWSEVLRIRGYFGSDLNDFASSPQQYVLYMYEPSLRAIALRYPPAQCDSIVGHLQRCCEEDSSIEKESLQSRWEAAGDEELDGWLAALASGASISRLNIFWYDPQWVNTDLGTIIESSRYLDHVKAEPLGALAPHVIPDSFLGRQLDLAAKEELRLPSVSPSELCAARLSRATVLMALAEQWTRLFQNEAGERCLRIAHLLCRYPASAAIELASFSPAASSTWRFPGAWPTFVVEREFLAKYVKEDSLQQLRRSTAADWCRTLLEHRYIPCWPWYGLLPDDWGPLRLLELWHSVIPQIQPASLEMCSQDSQLSSILGQIESVFRDSGDDLLSNLGQSLHKNAPALQQWTNSILSQRQTLTGKVTQ